MKTDCNELLIKLWIISPLASANGVYNTGIKKCVLKHQFKINSHFVCLLVALFCIIVWLGSLLKLKGHCDAILSRKRACKQWNIEWNWDYKQKSTSFIYEASRWNKKWLHDIVLKFITPLFQDSKSILFWQFVYFTRRLSFENYKKNASYSTLTYICREKLIKKNRGLKLFAL